MSERTRIKIGRLMVLAGTVLLTLWLVVRADAWIYEKNASRESDALLSRTDAGEHSLEPRTASDEGLIGRIEIPTLGLTAPVLEGTGERALRRGVGHVKSTAFPGERGNVALAAHRDTYFGKLGEVSTGDLITIRTFDGTYTYKVDYTLIVTPERGDLLAPVENSTLTLVTCYPFNWVGPAPKRFVVRASRVDAYSS